MLIWGSSRANEHFEGWRANQGTNASIQKSYIFVVFPTISSVSVVFPRFSDLNGDPFFEATRGAKPFEGKPPRTILFPICSASRRLVQCEHTFLLRKLIFWPLQGHPGKYRLLARYILKRIFPEKIRKSSVKIRYVSGSGRKHPAFWTANSDSTWKIIAIAGWKAPKSIMAPKSSGTELKPLGMYWNEQTVYKKQVLSRNKREISGNVSEHSGNCSGKIQDLSVKCSGNFREMSEPCPGNVPELVRFYLEQIRFYLGTKQLVLS